MLKWGENIKNTQANKFFGKNLNILLQSYILVFLFFFIYILSPIYEEKREGRISPAWNLEDLSLTCIVSEITNK
jgi:hypothetical protein